MNTLQKLQKLARVGKGMDFQSKDRILKMYGSMKWAFQAPDEVGRRGQEIFMEYYTLEDAAFVAKSFKRYVA